MSMNDLTAHGIDGFSAGFFKVSQHIVKDDIFDAVQDCFLSG